MPFLNRAAAGLWFVIFLHGRHAIRRVSRALAVTAVTKSASNTRSPRASQSCWAGCTYARIAAARAATPATPPRRRALLALLLPVPGPCPGPRAARAEAHSRPGVVDAIRCVIHNRCVRRARPPDSRLGAPSTAGSSDGTLAGLRTPCMMQHYAPGAPGRRAQG